MTTKLEILRDLIAGQSSLNAISERLHQPCKVLAAYLQDLESDGHVISHTIKDTIRVWRLTKAGMTTATTPNSQLRKTSSSSTPLITAH
jgi:DNA-binding HxlR family transcriptional regulator